MDAKQVWFLVDFWLAESQHEEFVELVQRVRQYQVKAYDEQIRRASLKLFLPTLVPTRDIGEETQMEFNQAKVHWQKIGREVGLSVESDLDPSNTEAVIISLRNAVDCYSNSVCSFGLAFDASPNQEPELKQLTKGGLKSWAVAWRRDFLNQICNTRIVADKFTYRAEDSLSNRWIFTPYHSFIRHFAPNAISAYQSINVEELFPNEPVAPIRHPVQSPYRLKSPQDEYLHTFDDRYQNRNEKAVLQVLPEIAQEIEQAILFEEPADARVLMTRNYDTLGPHLESPPPITPFAREDAYTFLTLTGRISGRIPVRILKAVMEKGFNWNVPFNQIRNLGTPLPVFPLDGVNLRVGEHGIKLSIDKDHNLILQIDQAKSVIGSGWREAGNPVIAGDDVRPC